MELTLKDFVSTEKKIECIGQTIAEASIDGIINPILADVLFEVNMLLTYTDIEVDKSDKLARYDYLCRKEGAWETFVSLMRESGEPSEIEDMYESMMIWIDKAEKFNNSIIGALEAGRFILEGSIAEIKSAMGELKNIDVKSLEQIAPLAEALGAAPRTPEEA